MARDYCNHPAMADGKFFSSREKFHIALPLPLTTTAPRSHGKSRSALARAGTILASNAMPRGGGPRETEPHDLRRCRLRPDRHGERRGTEHGGRRREGVRGP